MSDTSQVRHKTDMAEASKARRRFWGVIALLCAVLPLTMLAGAPHYLAWVELKNARTAMEVARIKSECLK